MLITYFSVHFSIHNHHDTKDDKKVENTKHFGRYIFLVYKNLRRDGV